MIGADVARCVRGGIVAAGGLADALVSGFALEGASSAAGRVFVARASCLLRLCFSCFLSLSKIWWASGALTRNSRIDISWRFWIT